MYHGQVMVDQERIPQLLQTAQLLEVRGLCEVEQQNKESDTNTTKGTNQSFLAGLLNTGISASKRSSSVISADSRSNSSPTPPLPATKRQKTTSSSSSRPVPMLQSILSQQLAVPNTPTFDLGMRSSTRALTALASKVQQQAGTKTGALPTSLENLLSANSSTTSHNNNGTPDIHSASSSSSDDVKDRLIVAGGDGGEPNAASYVDLLNRTCSSRGQGTNLLFIYRERVIFLVVDTNW